MTDAPASREPRFAALRVVAAGLLLLAEAAIAVASLFPRVGDDYRAYYLERRSHVWPPCHPTAEYVEVKDPIEFGGLDHDAACVLLGDGWSYPERWGVWNEGDVAHLALPYRPGERQATMTLTAHARRGEARDVQAFVDGVEAGRFSVPARGAAIAVPLPASDRPRVAAIVLRVTGAYRPQDVGENSEGRKLGVGLVRIERR